MAKAQSYDIYALSFCYGQRHTQELQAAIQIAKAADVTEHKIADIDLRLFGGSALTDDIAVPKSRNAEDMAKDIPITYVPARNTIFLSLALGWAEVIGAYDIFIGVNALDYSGYPDCRPEFIGAYEKMANLATAAGAEGRGTFAIHTPLINMTKAEIIKEGIRRGVDYAQTMSCYDPVDNKACGQCDACQLRLKGFRENGLEDPAEYVKIPGKL